MANIYIVSTPIGNLKDITYRAVEILRKSELIICEDTRVSKKLLDNYEIESKLTVLNEFNEDIKLPEILSLIDSFEHVSLISDAGTPLLSDPGYKLARKAIKMGHKIVPIPGASAILSALVASGMPTNSFTFLGFLPKSSTRQIKMLSKYQNENQTIIIFESPYRIEKTLQNLKSIFGDIDVSISRELTKKFEEITNFPISEHLEELKSKKPKGEFTLVFNPTLKES